MKVLIIDDDPDSLCLAEQRLKMDGHILISAGNGDQGLLIASGEIPDLILLGVQMQDKNGFQVCEELKMDSVLRNVPVIFISEADDVSEKVRGLDRGAVDFVTKPFDAFELRARVRAVLRTKRLQDLLQVYCEVDSLTEIYNRRVLMERLEQEWQRTIRYSTVISFIMADIDNFRKVNDTFGHPKGDQVLERIAGVLNSSIRSADIVGRYGGEEFGILMLNARLENAVRAAERYRNIIEKLKFSSRRGDFSVTMSFGVSDSRGRKTIDQLISSADSALCRAKRSGRNCVCSERAESL